MANTKASNVNVFKLKPSAYIKILAPINDKGMVTTGVINERTDPKNRKITIFIVTTEIITSTKNWTYPKPEELKPDTKLIVSSEDLDKIDWIIPFKIK